MADHKIILVVEGMEKDGNVRFDSFLKELQKLQSVLSRLDSAMVDGTHHSYFAVVGLKKESPATVVIEARTYPNRQDVRTQLFTKLSQTIQSIETGNIPEDIDYALLEDLKGLTSPIGIEIRNLSLNVNDSEFGLTEAFSKRIDLHLSEYETCFGTIEGMLEKINVHAAANVFTIYPDVGPRSVTCYFRQDLEEKALGAVKRRVAVSGLMKYRKTIAFPYHVDATDVEIYSLESELPDFNDLRGIAPDATGDLSSEQFIREFRNGWN